MKQSKSLWKPNKLFREGMIAVIVLAVAGGSFFIYQKVAKKLPPLFAETTESDHIGNSQTPSGVKTDSTDSFAGLDASADSPDSMAFFLSKNGKNYLDPNLGPSGRTIIPPEPGEVGTWDVPVPLINPLGSQKLYTNTRYNERQGHNIKQIINFTEYKKYLEGEGWFLSVNNGSGLPVQFLKEYAKNLGAAVLSEDYSDSFVFSLRKDGALWWCDAHETGYGYEFTIIKQTVVEAGKEYTVSGDTLRKIDIPQNRTIFCTEHTGEKFQTFKITLPSGKIRIKAECQNSQGSSTAYYNYDITLDSKESTTFILDNFPQAEGLYEWHLEPVKGNIPSSMTILLEEKYDLPRVKNGGELGSLLVKGVPPGSVYVCAQSFVSIDSRESGQRDLYSAGQETEGSLTPEGDLQFILPPGLWTIVNRASFMYNGSVRAQLIPVNSGEQTVVTLPESLTTAGTRLNSMTDDSELTGRIEITEAKDLFTTAELSVSVSDPLDRDINPSIENTTIREGSSAVEVTDIKRVVAPCSVALVIDSSGSMKDDMKATLEAAKTFLQALPEGSYVKVIDFDSKVTELKGETPQDAIKALSQISAGGSTKLYDATLKGMEAVKGKTRPAVVVFTDGRDSSLDKSGSGSANSQASVTGKIKENKIPVYTIGYGKRLNEEQKAAGVVMDGAPDIQCLLEFASAGDGQYFPAKDPEALTEVFTAISSKLGNQFVITYKRPTEHTISETPFVSIVVDNSGSMNSDPSQGVDCNYRMQKTVSLFHEFLEKLPPKTMMQLTTFQTPIMSPPLVIQRQTTTDQKVDMIKALGEMDAHGGTPLMEALRTAYENIIPVPSSKKVIVLLTDGGLQVAADQLQQYNDLLEKIKEKNISILFIGMGAHSVEQVFADAAKATGGGYVISEDIGEIQTKLDQLLSTLKETTPSDTIPISVSIKWDTADGDALQYAVADEVPFSQPKKAGPPIEPDMIRIVTGEPYHRYAGSALDPATASLSAVTGLGIPGTDNIITNQVSFDKTLSNKAMEMTVKRAVYLSRFQGVDAERADKQFIALEVELKNKTEKKIPYEIPSLFKHFYLGVNQSGLYPAGKATWLSDQPLAAFGNPGIQINPGEKKSGVIVFVVPDSQGISQMSLHFYDTAYGHIQIPLTGKMADKWLEIEKLPTSAPASLSDTFSMRVTGAGVKPAVEQYPSGEFSAFRIVEAKFESEVQALLNLNPKERIWLKIDTESGSLMSKLSDATAALPFGFLEPVMLGPASENPVRMAFDLPSRMDTYQSELYVDLATGSKELPVSSGEIYGAPAPAVTADGPGIRVTVNQLVAVPDGIAIPADGSSGKKSFSNMVILDVTVTDLPGNEGTKLPGDFFSLVSKNYKPASGADAGHIGLGGGNSDGNIIVPYGDTEKLVFGAGSGFGVFEGQSRRGVVLFKLPKGALEDWTLQSRYMENLQVPITKEAFASPELLGYKADAKISTEFEDQLAAAVAASVARNAALSDETSSIVNVSLQNEDGRQNVPMPSISTYGLEQLAQINSEAAVIRTLQGLRCLPVNRSTGYLLTYGYQPEAVLTQGYGEIGDLTNLAVKLFSKLGYSPEVRPLSLTDAGKKALLDFSGVDARGTVPLGVAYRNSAGESKTLVVPFMMDLSELKGFVYYPSDYGGNVSGSPEKAYIKVSVQYEPGTTGTVAGTAGNITGALGGDTGGSSASKLLMLETSIPLADLSMDAMDLCFMPSNGSGTAKSYHALLSTPNGVMTGTAALENPARVLGVEVTVKSDGVNDTWVHYSTLGEGTSLENFFQTLAINLPDLTEEAAAALDERARQIHDSAKNPDPLSIAKWYGRNAIYQFISGSSMFDEQMTGEFGLVLGRVSQPRCLIVTSCLDESNTMHTTMDLPNPYNQIHAGKQEARDAYQLLAGFYLSGLEAEVLPGNNKVSYLDLWTQAPSGTAIEAIPVMYDAKDREAFFKQMEQQGKYPLLLLKAVKENKKLILVPTEPTVFMGQERWAWMEIDPDTYKAISVFDNGLHSGMAEFQVSLLPSTDDTIQWLKGVWVGTNVSVWSMCSSTLKYGDQYNAVKIDAKKAATAAAGAVSKFFGLSGDIAKKASEAGDPKQSVGFSLSPTHKINFTISMSGIKGKVSQKMFNLSAGMKLAIDTYFK